MLKEGELEGFETFKSSVLELIKKVFGKDVFILALLGKFLRLITQITHKSFKIFEKSAKISKKSSKTPEISLKLPGNTLKQLQDFSERIQAEIPEIIKKSIENVCFLQKILIFLGVFGWK